MGRHRNMIIAPLNFPSRSLFCRAIHNNRGNVVARINRVTPANKPCGEGEGGKGRGDGPPNLRRVYTLPLIGPLRVTRGGEPAWTRFLDRRGLERRGLLSCKSRSIPAIPGGPRSTRIVGVVKPVVRLYPLPFSGFTLRRINGANCTINRRFPPHHPKTECTPRTRAARDKKVVNSFMDSGGRGESR